MIWHLANQPDPTALGTGGGATVLVVLVIIIVALLFDKDAK